GLSSCSPCIPMRQAGYTPPMAAYTSALLCSGCGSSIQSAAPLLTCLALPSVSWASRGSCSDLAIPDVLFTARPGQVPQEEQHHDNQRQPHLSVVSGRSRPRSCRVLLFTDPGKPGGRRL